MRNRKLNPNETPKDKKIAPNRDQKRLNDELKKLNRYKKSLGKGRPWN